MTNMRNVLVRRLRQEVEAYINIFGLDDAQFAELVNRVPGQVEDAQGLQPLTHRAIEGLRGGSRAHSNTSDQVRHFLLRRFNLPALMLDAQPQVAQMARQHMASRGLAHQTASQLQEYSGTYIAENVGDNFEIEMAVILDHEPEHNVLLARALITFRDANSASSTTSQSFQTMVHGYAFATASHIFLHLHDDHQNVPYTILMEPAEWPHPVVVTALRVRAEYPLEMPVARMFQSSTVAQVLFPLGYWEAIVRQLGLTEHAGQVMLKSAMAPFFCMRTPRLLDDKSFVGLISRRRNVFEEQVYKQSPK